MTLTTIGKTSSDNKVAVPNSIFDKLYNANAREIRTVLLMVRLLNRQSMQERTAEPKVTIKSSKFNNLTSNKSAQVLTQVEEDFSDVLDINIDSKQVTLSFKKSPITCDFTKIDRIKKGITLYGSQEFTSVIFDHVIKLRKKNTINLYLTISKFRNTNRVFSSDINTLFEDCHLKTLGNSSKKTLILTAIDDLNTHVGRDVVSLNELANNVMLSFNSSLLSVWQFNNKNKEANKPKTHREKDELIRSLKSENNMLNNTIQGTDKQRETTEKLYQEELDNLRKQIEKLKKDNEQLNKENEELRQANKNLASSKGINTNLTDNRVDKLQQEIKELKENQEHNEVSISLLQGMTNDTKSETAKGIDKLTRRVDSLIDDVNAMKVDKVTLEQFREVAKSKIEDANTPKKVNELSGEINNLKGTIISLVERIEQLENNNQHEGTFEGDQQQSKQEGKEHHGINTQKDNYDDFDFDDFGQ